MKVLGQAGIADAMLVFHSTTKVKAARFASFQRPKGRLLTTAVLDVILANGRFEVEEHCVWVLAKGSGAFGPLHQWKFGYF
jgi:hypothetical protein